MQQRSDRTLIRARGWTPLLCLALWGSCDLPTLAQSITTASDGTGTTIAIDGNTYHIDGGTQAGANLFHSFQAFGLSDGEIANFLSNPSITNILGRVTGGDPSIIDGLVQITGGNANLYLMNPAGIVFGAGASLNIGGDFVATTADQIGFAGGEFNATGANDYATLVGTPNQFAFLQNNPGAILNFGNLSTAGDVSLVAGTVLNQGTVASTQGNVTIAAIPGHRRVRISQPGMLLSFEVEADAIAAGIKPVDLPALLTGSGATTGGLPLPNINSGDVVIAGEVSGQQVDLYAAGTVIPTDPALVQGDTRVIRFSEMGENPDQAVFVDWRADNPQDLLYGAAAGTVTQIIERDENGIAVVSEQLSQISASVGELESVAIVAEGNAGDFWLGNQWITHENIGNYQGQLQQWGAALADSADLLLYSCFTALGATGEALVASMAAMTGVDVAASVNATGSANYHADWELEHSTGTIEATNPFTTDTLANWEGKLAIRTVDKSSNSGARSLRDALTDNIGGFAMPLADGDTITFNMPGPNMIKLNSTIAWSANNITIDGTNGGGVNAVIDGKGSNQVFVIGANNVTLQNLTVQNGSTAASGGGILHTGSGLLSLENTTITNNVATLSGGGIYSLNGNLTALNSTISGNSVVGLSGDGGGLAFANGDITLTNSTLINNSAVDRGGAIRTGSGHVSLTHSLVLNNSAGGSGGGVFSGNWSVSPTTGTVALVGSTVSGNWSGQQGGGIASGSHVSATQSTLAGNFSNGNGGGIYTFDGDITLTNATLSGNLASQNGGGVAAGGLFKATNSTIAFNRADFDDNGSGNGGGIFLSGTQPHAILNTIIAQNLDLGGEASDFSGDLSNAMVTHSLIEDTNGITGMALTNGVDGNIIGQDPLLAPLADNGAPTWTHALLPGSPALGAGDPAIAPTSPSPGTPPTQSRINIGTAELEIIPPLNAIPPISEPDEASASTEENDGVIFRDRVDHLLTNNQVCEAVELTEQQQTAAFQEHLGKKLPPNTLSCTEIQQRLPNNAVMLSVIAQTDHLHLITTSAQGDPTHYESPVSREVLAATITEFQEALTHPLLRRSDRFLETSEQLYQWLIAPLLPELQAQGVTNILFSLDEGLRSLPIAALHDGEQFLIENYQVSLIPSLSLTPTRRPQLQNASVLAMGIAEFENSASLPAVPLELASIIQQFPKTTHLTNEQATVKQFYTHLQTANSIVHLATHGRFHPEQEHRSYLQFWDDKVSFQELKQIDWSQTAIDLLVLSACQTALGDVSAEYGFAGLAVQAQADAAIAGLWNTHDVATMALMREFYRQLSLGVPKGESLRQAQLAMLNGTIRLENKWLGGAGKSIALPPELHELGDRTFWHPYYWSAFTLIGNPW